MKKFWLSQQKHINKTLVVEYSFAKHMDHLQFTSNHASVYEIPLHTSLYFKSTHTSNFAVVLHFSPSYTYFIDQHIFKSNR